MYDIIIIGAGVAGLTAAIYGRRSSKSVLVLEAGSYGGQIINTLDIENYPAAPHISGYDLSTTILNQAKELGAEIIFEKVIDITLDKEVITPNKTYKGKTIIIATGSVSKSLGLDNEKDLIGKGVSYCATCDGNFYKNKIVAVVGGGNTALEDALYLTDIAKKVYLIHRRDEFRGSDTTLKLLKNKDNIEFIYNSTVTKLIAKDKLNSIEITNNDSEKKEIEVDGLFIAIGQMPENNNFAKIIDLDDSGYVKAKEDCKTNVEGIFVAGDVRTKEVRQLVTATSDGAVAAIGAIKYINSLK